MYALTYRKSSRPTLARNRVKFNHSNREHSPQVRAILHRSSVQPKLTIGAPNDHYEQEADRVAEQVMRMPEPRVQRQVAPDEEEEEETIQTKPLFGQATPFVQRQDVPEEEEEEEPIQAKHVPGQSAEVTPGLAAHIQSLRGGGQPLPASTRAFFEPRFGHDFRQVRVHTEARAAETARALNAHAFTVGRDVVFGAGKYAPETLQGKRLLGHELTHVVQQHGSHMQPAQPSASGAAMHAATSLEPHVEMKAGSEAPSEGIGAAAVSLEDSVRRGLGPAAVAPQRGDVHGSPEKVRLNSLYSQRSFNAEAPGIQARLYPGGFGTNYAFDTYRIDASHLSDPDIIARFESLPLISLEDYRNRYLQQGPADLAVLNYINGLIAARKTQRLAMLMQTPFDLNTLDQELKSNKPLTRNSGYIGPDRF